MKKKVIDILILLLALSLVLYFSLKDNFDLIIKQLSNINILIFILAIVVLYISLLFKSAGLKVFLNEYNKKYTLKSAFNLTVIAQFLNAITPFQTGGQPFQIYLLKKDGMRITDSTNSMIKDFIAYQSALIIVGIIAIILNIKLNIFSANNYLAVLVLLGFVINVIVLSVLLFITFAKKSGTALATKTINFLFKFKIVRNRFSKENLLSGLRHFYELGKKVNKKTLFKGIIFHMLHLIILYMVPIVIFYSIGVSNINVIESISCTAFVMLIGNFIPIPGATGGIEYSFIQFFGHIITGPALYSGMLLWRFVTYILGIIVGAMVLMFKKRRC